MSDAIDIDDIGMPPRLEPDDAARAIAGNIDGERQPVADYPGSGLTVDETDLLV